MKKIFITIIVVYCISGCSLSGDSEKQIIADHTVVDRFDDIPPEYIDEVKKMWVSYAGESHSSGVRIGAVLLEQLDSRFQVNVTESGTPEAYTVLHLRLSRGTRGDVDTTGSWVYGYGEEDWFTSATAIANTKTGLTYCNTTGPALSVIGFGWCWDDAVYTNSTSISTYLSATSEYIDYCSLNDYPTAVIFTTGPVDVSSGAAAYSRYLSEQQIRTFAIADSSRILFDYADILSWNDSGVENQLIYNSNIYHLIHPDNMQDYDASWNIIDHAEDGDHIGEVGALRLAKAMCWMLARIAGWDGESSN